MYTIIIHQHYAVESWNEIVKDTEEMNKNIYFIHHQVNNNK